MPDIRAGGRKVWSYKHPFTLRTRSTRALQSARHRAIYALEVVVKMSVFTDTMTLTPLVDEPQRALDLADFSRCELLRRCKAPVAE
jgi:hypothetical protein